MPYFHSAKPLVAVNTELAEKVGFKHKYPNELAGALFDLGARGDEERKSQGAPYLPRWVADLARDYQHVGQRN